MSNEIDIDALISLIETRPILWDKTLPSYKNRKEKRKMWRQVCKGLKSNFEELDDEHKRMFGKYVIKRWVNMRDSFHKSLKKEKRLMKFGVRATKIRKYVYTDKLQFLTKVLCTSPVEDSLSDDEPMGSAPDNTATVNSDQVKLSLRKKTNSPTRKLDGNDTVEKSLSKALEESIPKVLDDDRHICFFRGIIPSLNSFSEDEVLEFQMGTLQLITNIKQSRYANPVAPFVVTTATEIFRPTFSTSLAGSSAMSPYNHQTRPKATNFIMESTADQYVERIDPLDDSSSSSPESKYVGQENST